jgi:hypothetical protein
MGSLQLLTSHVILNPPEIKLTCPLVGEPPSVSHTNNGCVPELDHPESDGLALLAAEYATENPLVKSLIPNEHQEPSPRVSSAVEELTDIKNMALGTNVNPVIS